MAHLTGELLIGGERRFGTHGEIKGVNPATGETLVDTRLTYDPSVANAGNIAAGANRNRSYTFTLPEGQRAVGALNVTVSLDYNGQLVESDETNNSANVVLNVAKKKYADLAPVSLEIEPGENVAVTGANGSGKTTLMLILAGREPTSGTIVRPGAVGLGEPGGTAVVLQHPETQVLGTRVADDVVWGLPPQRRVDVDGLPRAEPYEAGDLPGSILRLDCHLPFSTVLGIGLALALLAYDIRLAYGSLIWLTASDWLIAR